MKNASDDLDTEFNQVTVASNQEYPQALKNLETAIKNLTSAKEEYKNKTANIDENVNVNSVQIEKYKIEFLFTTLGNYAKREGVDLTFDIKEGSGDDIYNVDFTLIGSYIGITDFIYDVENDEKLNFTIENFLIAPNGATVASDTTTTGTTTNPTNTTTTNTTTTNTTTSGDTINLKSTFTVSDVGILLDS